jgi:sugar lactone lactonase YvrE
MLDGIRAHRPLEGTPMSPVALFRCALPVLMLAATLSPAPNATPAAAAAQRSPALVQRDVLLPYSQAAREARARGDLPGAIAAMRQARALLPDDPAVMFTLAQLHARAGDGPAALALLDTLAGRNTGFHPAADPAFAGLDSLPGFAAVLARYDRAEPVVVRSERAFTVREPDLFPEGIACDPRDGTLYLSSLHKRKVVRVSPTGVATDFTREAQDGLLGALGMKVDTRRGLLWVAACGQPGVPSEANQSGLWAFELATGRLAQRWLLPDSVPHTLNDLALDRAGNVYATDTDNGAIYRTSGPRGELAPFLPPGTFRGPNGIAVSDDDRTLYVAAAGRGITAVDLRSRSLAGVAVAPDVVTLGVDGLYVHGRTLVAVQNGIGRPRIVRYHLRGPRAIERVEILESRHPLFDEPCTGAIWRDHLYYVPNTHLDHANPDGTLAPSDSLADLAILRLPL